MSYGTYNKNYISSQEFLDKREMLEGALNITREEESFLDVMELMGRMEATPVPSYHHHVNAELYGTATIKTGGVTDNSGGSGQGDITLVLTDADGTSECRAGNLVMFASNYVGYIQSKTADAAGDQVRVLAVAGASVTTALLAAAAGQKLAFFSNAAGEGSTEPAKRRYGTTKYWNQVMSFKEATKITDVQQVSEIELKYGGKNFVMYKQQHETLMKHRADISFAMLMSQISEPNWTESSSSLSDGSSNPVQTTRGLDQYINTYGKRYQNATLDLDQIEDLTGELRKRRVGQDYLVFAPHVGQVAWDNTFNALDNSSVLGQAAKFSVDGKQLDLGVDSVRLYGFNFHKKYLPLLDHQNVTNFTGSAGFERYIYGVPMDTVKVHAGGASLPRIRCRYMPVGGEIYSEVLTGRLAPNPTNTESALTIDYQSIMGLEVLGADNFWKIEIAS